MDRYERRMVRRCSVNIMECMSNAIESVTELKIMLDNIDEKIEVPNLTKLKREIDVLRHNAYVLYLNGDYDEERDKDNYGFVSISKVD